MHILLIKRKWQSFSMISEGEKMPLSSSSSQCALIGGVAFGGYARKVSHVLTYIGGQLL